MRNIEDQLSEIMSRSDKIVKRKAAYKVITIYGTASVSCMLFIVIAVLNLPGIKESNATAENTTYGSLLMNTAYAGYVVVAFLALMMGVFLTLLAIRVRELHRKG